MSLQTAPTDPTDFLHVHINMDYIAHGVVVICLPLSGVSLPLHH